MRVLDMDVYEVCPHFTQHRDRYRSIIDVCTTTAIQWDNPSQDQFFFYSVAFNVKQGLDTGFLGSGTHDGGICTCTNGEIDGLDQHGLAGTGLACENSETITHRQHSRFNDTQVFYVKLNEHLSPIR
jgi:hypothetical protein